MNEQQIEKLEGLPKQLSIRTDAREHLKERQIRVETAPDYRDRSCHKNHRHFKPWQRCPKEGAYVLEQI